ncbi:hypothetical protein ABTY20_24760 [Streptomyces sp. NPDC126497]
MSGLTRAPQATVTVPAAAAPISSAGAAPRPAVGGPTTAKAGG